MEMDGEGRGNGKGDQCGYGEEMTDLPIEAVAGAINRCMNGKAGGSTGLVCELLKPCSLEMADVLLQLFQMIWRYGVVPSCWKQALLCPVPKRQSARDWQLRTEHAY